MNEAGVKRNTKRIGDISEAAVALALLEAGYQVCVPFGENNRFDLVIERDNVLARVQVKTGRMRNGSIVFNCFSSHTHRGGASARCYIGEIEYFGVYCPDFRSVYLVPVGDVNVVRGYLRVEAAKNNQNRKLRWAQAYLLTPRSALNGRGDIGLWSTCEAPKAPL
ncbi:MAG: hypothetical protein JO165_06670 [Candidatus Eremiobacteraeota bacterium]|nr:hypothetical protein [Candidatus Eremiobacteraeota bacterium]